MGRLPRYACSGRLQRRRHRRNRRVARSDRDVVRSERRDCADRLAGDVRDDPIESLPIIQPQFMSAVTETVSTCPLCGSGDATWIAHARDRLHHVPGEFAFVRCNACTLVRLSPRPTAEALGAYYPDDSYYSYDAAQSIDSI